MCCFFFKQKTAYYLRISDWSSDVCSSDLDTCLTYASKVTATDAEGNVVPVAHMCGHDMHVAWLVGAATLLSQARDGWKGTLMAVFQPGEETAQRSDDRRVGKERVRQSRPRGPPGP